MPSDGLEDFDWVSAQSRCSAASMFAQLLDGVKRDVQRRRDLEDQDDGREFEFAEDGDSFEVSRLVPATFRGHEVDAVVKFEREGRRIHIHGAEVEVDFTVVVALDVTGVCRFLVGEAMYSEWEIRRMALEQLFFD